MEGVEGYELAIAILFSNRETRYIGGQREGVKADFINRDLSIQGWRNFFDQGVTGYFWNKDKADCGVGDDYRSKDKDCFLPAAQFLP